MNCFICKEEINNEPVIRGEFHFHHKCINFKPKLTRQQKRAILREFDKHSRHKQVS